jgi:hypothetical protein
MDARRWIILDYVNVVVHIFSEEKRNYYGIERMWNDAEITEINRFPGEFRIIFITALFAVNPGPVPVFCETTTQKPYFHTFITCHKDL